MTQIGKLKREKKHKAKIKVCGKCPTLDKMDRSVVGSFFMYFFLTYIFSTVIHM